MSSPQHRPFRWTAVLAIVAAVAMAVSSCSASEKGTDAPKDVAGLQAAAQAQLKLQLTGTEAGAKQDWEYRSSRCKQLQPVEQYAASVTYEAEFIASDRIVVQGATAKLYGTDRGVAYPQVDATGLPKDANTSRVLFLTQPSYWVFEDGRWTLDSCDNTAKDGAPQELTYPLPVGKGPNGGQLVFTNALREGQCMPNQKPRLDPTGLTEHTFETVDCDAENANFTVVLAHQWSGDDLEKFGSPGQSACKGCPLAEASEKFPNAYCEAAWPATDTYRGWLAPTANQFNSAQDWFYCTSGKTAIIDKKGRPVDNILDLPDGDGGTSESYTLY